MSAKSTNLKVGMFAIAAVAIFVAGLMTLGARDRFKARTTFETAVAGHVTGLSVGSAVKFRGVPMGKVTDIRLAWSKYPETKHDYVVVEFQVDNEFLSPEQRRDPRGAFVQWAGTGLRAKLEGQGITGLSILTLDVLDPQRSPAPPIDWEPEHIYIPSAPSLFGAMLDSISVSLEKIRNLDVDGLVVDVRALLVSLDAVAVKLSKVDIESIGSEARDRLVELKTTNERLALLLQEARTALVGMNLPAVAGEVDVTLKDLRQVILNLDRTLETVGDKVGQIDVAPLNESLIHTGRATRELESLMREIRSYPSGALFGEPPAPARSVSPRKP